MPKKQVRSFLTRALALSALFVPILTTLTQEAQAQKPKTQKPKAPASASSSVSSPPPPPPPPAKPPLPPDAKVGGVLDFCALKPTENSTKFVKQRLVLTDITGATIAYGEEKEKDEKGNAVGSHKIMESIKAHNDLRQVFLTVFPMPRFYNVVAMQGGNDSLAKKPTLTSDEVNGLMTTAGDTPEAEYGRSVVYSLGCSDWLGVPRITGKDATWSKAKKQKVVEGKSVEYMGWNLSVTWTVELDIYKKEGDKWQLAKTVSGSNGGLLGAAFGLAGSALQGSDGGGDQPAHISAMPVQCEIPKSASGAAASIAGCAGVKLDFGLLGEASAPGSGQAKSKACQNVDDDVSHGEAAMKSVAKCEARKAMEQATLAVQKESKYVDGWKLFAPLQPAPEHGDDAVGISMGKEEGARRGDAYIAYKSNEAGQREQVGWGRLTAIGPGGTPGETSPSRFKLRAGEAPLGARMEEHAQIGILLGLAPGLNVFTSRGDLASGAMFGGAIMGGYNATQWVNFGDEIWSRVYFSMFFGKEGESLMNFDLMPELVFYGPNRLNFFVAPGFGYSSVSRTIPQDKAPTLDEKSRKLSGSAFGIAAQTGAEFLITPDWSSRVTIYYRQNFSKAKLTDENDVERGNAGTLSGLRVTASVAYTF